MREEAKLWLGQADEDFITAKKNIEIKRFYASVFFSQQAAEKALKGLYLEKKREPYLRHNLVEMADILGAPEEVKRACRFLNPQYAVSRYPDAAGGLPADAYDKFLAEKIMESAKKVINWVKKNL